MAPFCRGGPGWPPWAGGAPQPEDPSTPQGGHTGPPLQILGRNHMKRPVYLLATLLLASGALAQEQPPAHPEPLRDAGKAAPKLKAEPVPLPGGEGGIGLDDLAFPPGLRQVVVP